MPKLKKRQLIAVGAIILILLLYRSFQPQLELAELVEPEVKVSQVTVAPVAVRMSSIPNPVTSAEAVYITDEQSGAELFAKNAGTLFAPASTTKLMTALVARQVYEPGSVLQVPSNTEYEGSIIGLAAAQKFTIEALLRGALIQSGNDAATVIAENYPGGEAEFVRQMNLTAKQLNMSDTFFNNPSGFDNKLHQTTARDLAILSREVLKDEFLSEVVATKSAVISDVTKSRQYILYNTNQLLKDDPRVVGIKTGTTEEAGQVLITAVNDQGKKFIIVVLASDDRYADTKELIDWVLAAYTWYQPIDLLDELNTSTMLY